MLKIFRSLVELVQQAIQFVTYDIWHLQETRVKPRDLWLIKLLKIIFISIRGFLKDKVSLRASALTYYTLIAIVPVLAVILAITRGFGLGDNLIELIHTHFPSQDGLISLLLKFSESTLSRATNSIITGVSIVFLLWAVLKLLNNIESSFNHIWQIKRPRPWSRKVADYIAVIIIAPIFLVVSGSISIVLNARLTELTDSVGFLSYIAPIVKQLLKLSSYVLLWGLFTFMYVALPYTKVKIGPAAMAGIVAGTAFHLVQNFYIYSQVMVSKYSAIYGSFAAIPLFLIWAQVSWLVLLFGAELAFAAQNVERYEHESATESISHRYKKLIALLIMRLIVVNYQKGGTPYTSSDIASILGIPVRLSREMTFELNECGLLLEIATQNERVNAYVPAMDIHSITVSTVFDYLERWGSENYEFNDCEEVSKCRSVLNKINKNIEKGDGKTLVMDL